MLAEKGRLHKFSKARDMSKVKCFYYKKPGHFKSECMKKKQDMKERKKGKSRKEKGASANVAADIEIAGQKDFAFTSDAKDTALIIQTNTWLTDSAAMSHVCKDHDIFSSYKETPNHVIKGLGGHEVEVCGRGTNDAYFSVKGEHIHIALTNVLHAPASENNLMSLECITDSRHRLLFSGTTINILLPKGKIISIGKKARGLYQMDVVVPGRIDQALIARGPRSWGKWHGVMRHISYMAMKQMKSKEMVDGMEVDTSEDLNLQCTSCIQAKPTVSPFSKELISQPDKIRDLTIANLWGTSRVPGICGERYFLGLTDVQSRRTVTYFLKTKPFEIVLAKLKQYHSFFDTQVDTKMHMLHADNESKFVNKDVHKWLDNHGIKLELTALHSSAQSA